MFFEMRFDLGTLDSGERSLPFRLLVQKGHSIRNAKPYVVPRVERRCLIGSASYLSEIDFEYGPLLINRMQCYPLPNVL